MSGSRAVPRYGRVLAAAVTAAALTVAMVGVVSAGPVAGAVEAACRDAGYLVNAVQPDAIRLAPPLILTPAQAGAFLAALPAILDQAAGHATAGHSAQSVRQEA